MSDPYTTLGVAPDATLDELTAARRRLAMQLHPDRGGDEAAMQQVNRAFDLAVERLMVPPPPPSREPAPSRSPSAPRRGVPRNVQYDWPSFTLDVLPVEAFEALVVVTTWMGEILVDDPPYVLETMLHDPSPCWCRLDLVPDAGGTTVSLTVAGLDGDPAPEAEAVRDEFVANLNRL